MPVLLVSLVAPAPTGAFGGSAPPSARVSVAGEPEEVRAERARSPRVRLRALDETTEPSYPHVPLLARLRPKGSVTKVLFQAEIDGAWVTRARDRVRKKDRHAYAAPRAVGIGDVSWRAVAVPRAGAPGQVTSNAVTVHVWRWLSTIELDGKTASPGSDPDATDTVDNEPSFHGVEDLEGGRWWVEYPVAGRCKAFTGFPGYIHGTVRGLTDDGFDFLFTADGEEVGDARVGPIYGAGRTTFTFDEDTAVFRMDVASDREPGAEPDRTRPEFFGTQVLCDTAL